MQPLPLQDHTLFHSTDLDEARERVAAVFCPHRLERQSGVFNARQHHLPGQALSLNYIEYGAKTLIEPGELGGFYLVQIPLSGGAEVSNGGHYDSGPGHAAVLNPHLPTRMIWAEGTRQVLLQIRRTALQAHLASLGVETHSAITFQGGLDLTQGPGATLRRLILWLVAEADAGHGALGRGLMARQIEATLMSGLLETQGHDHAARLHRHRAAPRPRHIRLAEGFIEAHLDQPITLHDMAAAAGVSARGLQTAFRSYRGTTPLGFWRDMRLSRAHQDLLDAEPGTRVTDIALKWGFTHFGRFAEGYRARYGLSPRDTLQTALGPTA